MKKDKSDACLMMAETVGFEPTEDLHPQRISSPLHSASLPRFLCAVQIASWRKR